MAITCDFEFFENTAKVFYSGQLLKGRIILNTDKTIPVRGIYIHLIGEGSCSWEVEDGEVTGNEEYLDQKVLLVKTDNGEIRLKSGEHKYDFEYDLPKQLPTSLAAKNGYIRYEMRAIIDLVMWRDKVFSTEFTVIKPLDLNEIPHCREPILCKGQKTYSSTECLVTCYDSTPVTITARLPAGGYVPWQKINVEFDAENQSSQNIEHFFIQIVKRIEYTDAPNYENRKIEDQIVAVQKVDGCEKSKSRSHQVNLDIPYCTPTDFTTSNICKVRYCLRIIGTIVADDYLDACLEIPITIGTYPLLDDTTVTEYVSSNVSSEPTAPPLPVATAPPVPTQAPTAYEEVVKDAKNCKDKIKCRK